MNGQAERKGGGYGRVLSQFGLTKADVEAYSKVTKCDDLRKAARGLVESGITGEEIARELRLRLRSEGAPVSRFKAAEDVLKVYLAPQAPQPQR